MHINYKLLFSLIIMTFSVKATLFAQQFDHAVEHMNYMTAEFNTIAPQQWEYTQAVARGKKARKVEKRRKEVLETLRAARTKIKKIYSGVWKI